LYGKVSSKFPIRQLVIAAALVLAAAAPALAQTLPSYASPGGEAIKGRISGFDGKYNLSVRDDRGFVDNVKLHDGTVINPIGLRLVTGMRVTILGRPDGSAFLADEIDTPYHYGYPVAYYPYPAYPYPYWGGPYYRVGFGFHFR
jgi:hypothetical protein